MKTVGSCEGTVNDICLDEKNNRLFVACSGEPNILIIRFDGDGEVEVLDADTGSGIRKILYSEEMNTLPYVDLYSIGTVGRVK